MFDAGAGIHIEFKASILGARQIDMRFQRRKDFVPTFRLKV